MSIIGINPEFVDPLDTVRRPLAVLPDGRRIRPEEYYASGWKRKLRDFKQKRAWQCYACRSLERLHLHHKTYDRFGHEHLDDLVPLCASCHTAVHLLTNKEGLDLALAHKEQRRRIHLARHQPRHQPPADSIERTAP